MSNDTPPGGGFGQFVPGFEFLQNLVNPVPTAASGVAGMPNLGHWVAPTLNVEDLEKRIEELKAVHFWLDQNSKALSATIQAMEVQKMTLVTLRDLNVNFGDLAKAGDAVRNAAAQSFANRGPAEGEAPTATAAQTSEPKPQAESSGHAGADQIDPMQWWGALQQQFQNIAVSTLQDLAKQQPPAAARKATTTKAAAKTAPAKKKTASVKKKASAKTRAR